MPINILLIISALFYPLIAYLILKSINNLTPKSSSYYDFGKRFPKGGSLIFIIYLIFLIVCALVMLLLVKFNLIPASA